MRCAVCIRKHFKKNNFICFFLFGIKFTFAFCSTMFNRMKKILLIIVIALTMILWSCATTPKDNADKVVKAVNEYCDKVEKAISDEVIDDDDVTLIKDSEKKYMDLIAEITESYAGNANDRAEFEQQYTSDEVWVRMADVTLKLANTEGYAKLSLTNK